MALDWLKNLVLVDTGRIRAPKDKNPKGNSIRIFSDGSVYPGKELVDNFNLEYKTRGELTGNGIDLINSKEWDLEIFQNQPAVIIVGFTNKNNPKVDLFGTCRYNDDNTPKSSVLTQGAKSEKLLELVKEFGYLNDEQAYCDLVVLTDHSIAFQDGIANIPKVYDRGTMKGTKTYQRRENETFYALITQEQFNEMNRDKTVTLQQEVEEAGELVVTNN